MGFNFDKAYHYDGGTPPSHEELQKEKTSTNHEQIIWDLSSQLGEAKHKIKMLEWKIDEMKKIINE